MRSQRIVRHILVLGSGQIGTWLISTLHYLLLTRYLGPGRLGELAWAGSVVQVLAVVSALGMAVLITRTVARTPEAGSRMVSTAMIVRVVLTIPVIVALFVYARVVHLNPETSTALYILAVGMIVTQFSGILVAAFQGYERMGLISIGSVAGNLFGLGVIALIIVMHGGVVLFAAGTVVSGLLLLVLNLYWSRSLLHLTWRVAWTDVHEIVVGSVAFWASNLFLIFYMYIDAVVLASMAGASAVGYYTPPTRIFTVFLFIPSILGSATLPLLSRLGVDPRGDFTNVSRKTLSVLIVSGMPLAVGLATFAGPTIALIFGPSFGPSVPVMTVLAASIPFTCINIQAVQVLTARDHQWRWTIAMAASCVLNPLINIATIPIAIQQWHNGALGAAIALFITELGMAAYAVVMMRDIMLHATILRTVAGAMVGAGAQAGIIWLIGERWLLVGEVLGGMAYLVVVVLLGSLPLRDLLLLRDVALRREQRVAA